LLSGLDPASPFAVAHPSPVGPTNAPVIIITRRHVYATRIEPARRGGVYR
jgi:hypothetical protein